MEKFWFTKKFWFAFLAEVDKSKMGFQGFKKVVKEYSPSAISESYLNVYEKLLCDVK